MVNKYLVEELTKLGIWNEELKNNIVENKSIQFIQGLDEKIKEKYKTVGNEYEDLIDMSRDREKYIVNHKV